MTFFTEPKGYDKTILSDLQGGWSALRELIVDNPGFNDWERMLFHVDEAMSWETVRSLERMKPLLMLIKNIAAKANVPKAIHDEIEDIHETLEEVYQMIERGERI